MRYLLIISLFLLTLTGYAQSHFGSKTFAKPSLSNVTAYPVSQTTAFIEAYVTNNGGATINAYRILLDDVNPPVDTTLYSPLNNIIYGYTPVFIWDAPSGLTSGTTYYIKVCASNIAGETCSNVVSITQPATVINIPSVTTNAATSVGQTTATLNGDVTSNGGGTVSARGFYYSTTYPPTSSSVSSGAGTGTFTANLSSLTPATTYYARAYAVNETGEALGSIVSFTTTTPSGIPSVETITPHTILYSSAVSGGTVIHDGGAAVSNRGICFGTSAGVDIGDNVIYAGGYTGEYSLLIPNLTSNTTYYVRAFAININGVAYGDELSFTTANAAGLATVTTTLASSITTGTATLGGNVTADGGSTVTSRGVCYSLYPNPVTGSPGGTGTGTFNVSVSYLTPGTIYYYRAYATNSTGTAYGAEYTFETLNPTSVPEITTLTATEITTVSAIAGGQITYNGNSGITESGICYSTSSTPTTADSKIASNVYNYFTVMLHPLNPNTTYYYRAYAINGVGTGYGNIHNFTTANTLSIPVVTVNTITGITITTAGGGGNVTSDGGSSVTVRGLVWNSTGNPSLYSYSGITYNGTGTGSFSSSLYGLNCGTTYFVKAYATNSVGTAYSTETKMFTTPTPAVNYDLYSEVTTSTGAVYTFGDGHPEITLSNMRSIGNNLGNPPVPYTFTINHFSVESCTSAACVVVGSKIYGRNSCAKSIATGYYFYAPNGLVIAYPYPVYIIHITNGVVDYTEEWYPD